MANTVFRKDDAHGTVLQATGTEFRIALSLKQADTDHDGKVSGDEMATMMYKTLPPEMQKSLKTKCSIKDTAELEHYIKDMQNAARIAVTMDILQEVTVPDVPNLCQAATKLGI